VAKPPSPPRPSPSGLATVAAFVLYGWVLVWSAAIAAAGFDVSMFNGLWRLAGTIGGRILLCLVVVCALFHTVDGLRRLVLDGAREVARVDLAARLAAVFLTAALGVPASVVILWPALGGQR
jgi:succinate dehydrogenase/fumarate reductase cytochrome b subunit